MNAPDFAGLLPAVSWKATGSAESTSTNQVGVDISAAAYKEISGEMLWVIDVSIVTGTTPTLDLKCQESDTSGGTYTDVPGQVVPAQITAVGIYLLRIPIWGRKKFLRYASTITGTTPAFTYRIIAVFGQKHSQ